jgi:hypothetical protein
MYLLENAERIDRLVAQGEVLLKALCAERAKAHAGSNVEFLCGEFAGWCSTLHTVYHDHADEIVNRARARTNLPVALEESKCGPFRSIERGCSTRGICRWK